MAQTPVVIIPYFSETEIERYLRIADQIERLGPQQTRYEFLLASSPLIAPSRRLGERFSRIAPTSTLACPTQIFGYPIGATAMFWDCMDHIAARDKGDGGFSLWMESDMVPVQADWLDRLAGEWERTLDVLVMGCYVPDVHRRRLLRRPKLWIEQHINGGACYSKTLANEVPKACRRGAFDVSLFPFLQRDGRFRCTEAIAFSTVDRCRHDLADPRCAILHGFLQDKDAFLERCLTPLTGAERAAARPGGTTPAWQRWWKMLQLSTYRRRRSTLVEAVLLEQALWALRAAPRPDRPAPALARRAA